MIISSKFPRPRKELLDLLAQVSTASVGEAMAGANLMHYLVRPIIEGSMLIGPATTCVTVPTDNLSVHVALQVAKPGDVLVITSHGGGATGLWGELLTTSAKARGIAGVVTDGAVRDTNAIRRLGFPVWSARVFAQGVRKSAFGGVNEPVVCGGVLVRPGDLIIADNDGVAVIPQDRAESIIQLAVQREEREALMKKDLEKGATPFELFHMEKTLNDLGIEIDTRE